MKSLGQYIVEVDLEKPYTRKIGDIEIFNERVGADYDLVPQEGVVKVAIENPKAETGDNIVFFHMASDRRTDYFKTPCYAVKPNEVFAKKDGETYTAIERIVANKVEREPKKTQSGIYLESKKQEIPQLYEIISQPEGCNFGQFIYVTAHADYWIERLGKFFIKPDLVIASADKEHNITKIENDFSILEIMDEEVGYKENNGIYIPKHQTTDKFIGKMLHSNIYKKGRLYFYKKKKATELLVKGSKYHAIRKPQIYVEL